jgi:hypothetical protein
MDAAASIKDHSHNVERLIGPDWTVEAHLQIPRIGWEMDNDAWAVRDRAGDLRWLTTDHARMVETTREDLASQIADAKSVIDRSVRALAT